MLWSTGGDLTGPSGSIWAQQGWVAPLLSQGWWVKGTNGETEARLGRGAARGQGRTLGSPRPIRGLGSVSGGCGKAKRCKSLKIKGAVGRGCARACPCPAPRGSSADLAANPAVPGWMLASGPGNASFQRAGGCPPLFPLLVQPCGWRGALCRSGDTGAELGCRRVGWVTPRWHPEEFQRGPELGEPWGPCPCAPQCTEGGSEETEAASAGVTPVRGATHGVPVVSPRPCRAEGGSAVPVCRAGKAAGRRGLAGHQTPGTWPRAAR